VGAASNQATATIAGSLRVDNVVFSDGSGTRTSPAISTATAGQLLLVFAASDGPQAGGQTLAITGGGLSWALVARMNTQPGSSEIWKAVAPGVLANATVTSTPSLTGFNQSLTVLAFAGAGGTGAAFAASGIGVPSVSLTTTRAGSLVYGVGNDWDGAVARTVGASQEIVHQWLDTGVGDTFWVQKRSAPIAAAGTVVQLNDTAPTSHRWNLAAVEILAPAGAVNVPNLVGQTRVTAQSQVTSAGLTVGAVTTQPSATAPINTVLSQSPTGGSQVAAGSAVNLVVSSGPASSGGAPTVDKTVASDGAGTRTTPAFSTATSNELLLAFAASDGPSSGSQTLTVSGAGLAWTLVKRVNAQHGSSEIWRATATSVLTNATVTSTPAVAGFRQSLTVVSFRGASGVGASVTANAATGAPTVSLTTTKANALVYGVANDWDRAVARSVPTTQVMVHQSVDTVVGDTYWVQTWSGSVATAGTIVRLNDTAPTTDRWNFAAVEVVP
jgi:hypothetical protein